MSRDFDLVCMELILKPTLHINPSMHYGVPDRRLISRPLNRAAFVSAAFSGYAIPPICSSRLPRILERIGRAVGVGLDWLSGEPWNGRRWPGVPTLPDDRDLLGDVGDSFRGLCGRSLEILGLSQRCRVFVDGSMGGCTVQG